MALDHLDRLYDQFVGGGQAEAIEELAVHLDAARADGVAFGDTIAGLRQHPIFPLLCQDPHTRHSVERPRGYPGDAALIDMIYRFEPPADPGPFGRSLFDRTVGSGASEAVRQRLSYARHMLNAAVDAGQRICSLAGGHAREAEGFARPPSGRFTVVDQDARVLITAES